MTVAALPSTISYIEDGSTVAFAAPFRFKAPQHLIATRYFANASIQVLTYGTDYTATGGSTDAGGTLTVAVAAVSGTRLVIQRRTPRSQSMSYTTNDRFPAKSHEGALDNEMLVAQENSDAIADQGARGVFSQLDETGFILPPRAEGAGKLLGFDADPAAPGLKAYELTAEALETLASLASAIATVAAHAAQIDGVYGDLAHIDGVAANLAALVTVATNIASVNTLAGDVANINVVAAAVASLNAVATNIAAVVGVSGSLANVSAVASDLALGPTGSYIIRSLQAATDAVAAAAAAAAAVASVPVGAGIYIEGIGPPTAATGTVGAWYYDTANLYLYGPKTSLGWPAGVYTPRSAVPSTTRFKLDLRVAGATLPSTQGTVTRASSSTDMLCSDPHTYAPNTFGNNVPVIRQGKGLFAFMRAQQLLANPGAPVVETVTVPVGVIAVTAWGPAGSSLTSSLGTAVGTGVGALAGNAGVPQYITITTAGTITLTPAGGLVKANVVYNPSTPSVTEAVPYIASQSIREADQIPAGSAFLAAVSASAGYLLMGVSDAIIRNYGAPPCILGLNNSAAHYAASNTSHTIIDPAFHQLNAPLGSGNFITGTTIARTWDATATVSFGGGDRLESSFAFQHNNGVAVTSAAIGCAKGSANPSGQQTLNGCIGWWEYNTVAARLTDEALYAAYTTFKLPTIDDYLRWYDGAPQFPRFLDALRRLNAGTIDHVPVIDFGSSHHAGTSPTAVNVRASGRTAQMVAELQTEGYSVNDDFFGGPQTYAWAAGVCPFDSRLTYTGAAPQSVLNQNGVVVIRIPAGTVVSFNPTLSSAQFRLAFYFGTSYGSLEVSKDGGATPIVPIEGGSATIATAGAAAIAVRNFAVTLGANTWSMKASGASVDVSFGYSYNPIGKQIVFGNMACYGYTTAGLSLDASPEQSVLLPVRTFAPVLSFGFTDDTNSMSPALTQSVYSTGANAILASLLPTADVIAYTDPPSDLSFVAQSVQNTIYGYDRAIARANYLPIVDFAAWSQTYSRLPAGFYDDTKHLTKRAVKRLISNQQKALFKRLLALV